MKLFIVIAEDEDQDVVANAIAAWLQECQDADVRAAVVEYDVSAQEWDLSFKQLGPQIYEPMHARLKQKFNG